LSEYAIRFPYFILNFNEIPEEKLSQGSLVAFQIQVERANNPLTVIDTLKNFLSKYQLENNETLARTVKTLVFEYLGKVFP
jgi:hypothetical protein